MAGNGSEHTLPAAEAAVTHRTAWRRRQVVVDARYQLRAGVLVGVVALVLLGLLNVALLMPQGSETAAGSSRASTAGLDASWGLVLLGSVVLVAGITLIGVLESHRTAGAAYAIRRAVDALEQGRPDVRVRLRRGDHLQELAASINRLAATIDAERAGRTGRG